MRTLPAPFVGVLGGDEDGGELTRAAIALLLLVVAGAASLRLTLRLVGPLTGVVLALALMAPAAGAAAPALTYACSPGDAHCIGWYRGPMTLTWDWDGHLATPSAGKCDRTDFVTDTKGTETFCEVVDGNQQKTRISLVIRVDATPPTVTAAVPDRPPDHNNWFNHPVGFAFQASDATSGVAGCDSVAFAGPEGEGVAVTGGCRDVAGNASAAAFPLNYDATPPKPLKLEAVPGDERVRLDWSLAGGAVAVEVTRVAPGSDAVVYSGSAGDFVDRRRRNGVRQRYRVTAIDRAGNRAATSASVVPTDSPLLTPAQGSRLQSPPLLTWKDRQRATYYNVQLFRGGRKVLSRWPRTNELRLERTWRFTGQRRRLVPGRYVWFVWPGFGERAERDYGRLLGKQSFVIAR